MGFLSKIFGTDIESEKRNKFQELESHFVGDSEMINSSKATWLTSRGNAYAQRNQFEQAIEDFKDAIKLNHNHISAYVSLGMTYVAKRMLGEAIDILEKADILDKDSEEFKTYKEQPQLLHILNQNLNHALGMAYMEMGNKEKAISHFEKSLVAIEEQKNLKKSGGIGEQDWEQNERSMSYIEETTKQFIQRLK